MTESPNLSQLSKSILAFREERSWQQYHDPKNLVMAFASEVGELSAIVRWVANSEPDNFARVPANRRRIAHEIGDSGILLLSLCDRLAIDPADAIEETFRWNARNYPADCSRGRSERPDLD